MHDDVIERLCCLVQACNEAAVSGHDLAEPYMAVRADAAELNQRYGWATSEEFEAVVPSIESLLETEALDRAFGATATPGLRVECGMAARLGDALTEHAGWATGLRLAYERLRETDAR